MPSMSTKREGSPRDDSDAVITARGGAVRVGIGIGYYTPGIIELIGREWDWIWLDGQHGQIVGYDAMLAMVRACDAVSCPAYVRVRDHQAGGIGAMLDIGATAIIVPQVDTVEEARALVKAAKFPPLGNRSFGSRRLFDRDGPGYASEANEKTRLICQIESPEAIENAKDIISTPGVDGLFIGPDDLSLRWGESDSGLSDRDRLDQAVRYLGGLCKEHGKICICPAIDSAMITHCIASGIEYLVATTESRLLRNASKECLINFRSVAGESSATEQSK